MFEKIKNTGWDEYAISFFISLFFHLLLLIIAAFFFNLQNQNSIINSVYLDFQKKDFFQRNELEKVIENENKIEPEKEITNESSNAIYNFDKTEYDTSEVKQVYKESTRNVSLRYPNGWTYIDQNVKEKLDGVTFWSAQGNYEIPPYVFLEVQDKYIFNPSRYKYKIEQKGNIYYYNDPEEMEGYFTQIIYIRTDSDEDYSLKLMVKGKEIFYSFLPVFFSMAKSFSFGK